MVSGWSMQGGVGAEHVVKEVRHGAGVQPSSDGVDCSNRSRPAVIAHKQLVGHLTIMIKVEHNTHKSEILEKAIGVKAANVTDCTQSLSGQGLCPMLEGEVDHRNLSIDVVEGVELVVCLLMALHGDGVAVEVDGRPGHHLVALFRGVEHHGAHTSSRGSEMEGQGPTGSLHCLGNEDVGAMHRLPQVHIGEHLGCLVLAIANVCLHHGPLSRDRAGGPRARSRRWGRTGAMARDMRVEDINSISNHACNGGGCGVDSGRVEGVIRAGRHAVGWKGFALETFMP